MQLFQVFRFGLRAKGKPVERVEVSTAEVGDIDLKAERFPLTRFSRAVNSQPELKAERKSGAKLLEPRHASMPPRFEVNRVGGSTPLGGRDIPSHAKDLTQYLWRDRLGAEELAGLLLTPREIERQEVINELILTEKVYVEDLNLINEVYIEPLRGSGFVDPAAIAAIFLNLPSLLIRHQLLLQALTRRAHEQAPVVKEIADVLLEWIRGLDIYSEYLVPQRRALAEYERVMATNQRFAAFVRGQSARRECRGLDLQGYLIKPFQRLLRYPLLFKSLLEVSSSGTLDYLNAHRCQVALQSLITRIQEAKFRHEQAPTLEAWLTKIPTAGRIRLADPGRRLYREGALDLVRVEALGISNSKGHGRRFFKGGVPLKRESYFLALFGDVLVHVPECHRRGLNKGLLLASPHPAVTLCKVTEVRNLPDCPQAGIRNWFLLVTVDTSTTRLILEAPDEPQKLSWLEAIRRAIPTHTGP
ncbi:hypothetical protein L0F63_003926 [Massospora cicadina]|nr:hypothetical protein L0F63_003926 [Massospora cicadina]